MSMLFGRELEGAWAGVKLMLRGAAGGGTGAEAVRELIVAGRDAVRERDEARAQLADAQVSIRALVGQPFSTDPATVVPNAPIGHVWVSAVRNGYSGLPEGTMLCTSCTGGKYGGANETQAPPVTATQCLARHLAKGVHEPPAPAADRSGCRYPAICPGTVAACASAAGCSLGG